MNATPQNRLSSNGSTFESNLKKYSAVLLYTVSAVFAILVFYGIFGRGLSFWLLLFIPVMHLVFVLFLAVVREVILTLVNWLSVTIRTPEKRKRFLRFFTPMMLIVLWLVCIYMLM